MGARIKVISLICCAVLLGAAMMGCSSQFDKAPFVGEWELLYGSDSQLSAEEVSLAKSLGNSVVLTLEDDGEGKLNLYGDIKSLTWSLDSRTTGTLTVKDSGPANIKLENDTLVLENSKGSTLTFSQPQG